MASYTIKAVEQSAQGGEGDRAWTRQKLLLENQAGAQKEVSLFCNRFTPVPKVGDVLEGEVTPNERNPNWLPELRLPRKSQGGGGGRPEDPRTRASIAMQASQKVAVDLARFAFENNLDETQQARLMEIHGRFAEMIFLQVDKAQQGAA